MGIKKAAWVGLWFGVVAALGAVLLVGSSLAMQAQHQHGVICGAAVFALMACLIGPMLGIAIYVAFHQLDKSLRQ